MPERNELEDLFLANLPVIEKILGGVARRFSLTRDAADEFGAWAKLRMVEDDYAVLGKFRGESSLSTYLTVVLAMLYREYRVVQWGRWRPSAAARRGGELAIRLEILVQRDGVPIAHAGETLRTAGLTTLDDRELAKLVARFPKRAPLRPIELGEPPTEPTALSRADETIDAQEAASEANVVQKALQQALEALPSEDRLIVRMHFMEELTVADIAKGLSLPQKPLYKRLARVLDALRMMLEHAGVSRDHVRALSTGPP